MGVRRGIALVVVIAFALVRATACGGNVASIPDAAPPMPDSAPSDASVDLDADDPNAYHDLTDTRFWSSVDLRQLFDPPLGELRGVCFDGRYVYWGASIQPPEGGVYSTTALIRYDTHAPFDQLSSWTRWAPGYVALDDFPSAFDGQFLYIGLRGFTDLASQARYDTTMMFGDPKSLSFSAAILGGLLPSGFPGVGPAAFDGRALYLPADGDSSIVVRHDVQASFVNRDGWTLFDHHLRAGQPATIASPYVVLTPRLGGDAVLYDTRLPFDAQSSWSSVPMGSLTGDEYFTGSGTDGRWIYYVPSSKGPDISHLVPDGLVARYDASAPLTSATSWQTFQTTQLDPNALAFGHPSWDGRYMYFMTGGGYSNQFIVVRYDTRRDFESTTSWSTFDMNPLLPFKQQSVYWAGPAFDGEFLYIPGSNAALVMRFDARSPRKMPPGFSGTFY